MLTMSGAEMFVMMFVSSFDVKAADHWGSLSLVMFELMFGLSNQKPS